MNLHEVYLAAQIATKEVIKDGGSSKPIDAQVNGKSENAVQNKAIYDFVNSSVANNTAYFKGTYNSVAELETIVDATNNDYAFVVNVDIYGNTVYKRYKYNGDEWRFEYALNNSSFTANQWATINSGVTSADIQNLQDDKVDKIDGKGLSTNDFTDADESKLDSLENYDDMEIKAEILKTAEQSALNCGTLGYQRKNLLPNTATTKIVNGVTFTINDDGSVKANGTATALVTFAVSEVPSDLEGKKLRLSGCPTGGNYQTGYALYIAKMSDGLTVKYDTGNGVEADIPDEPCNVRIVIRNGVTVSNLIFRPMLRYAEIADDTYEPYTPSVQEQIDNITDQIFGLGESIPSNSDLNNYKKPGIYYSMYGANSATLVNTPYKTGGFRFEVSLIAAQNTILQKIYPNSKLLGCFFMRNFTDDAWGSWYKFTGEEVTT